MHIGIAGPLATLDIEHLLDGDTRSLPREMSGSALLATLIEGLLGMGHTVSAFTTDPALVPYCGNQVVARGKNLTVYYVPRRRHSLRFDRGAHGRMLDLFALERRCLTEAMRIARPEIVHAHWTYEFAAAALASGLPYLVTCHDSPWAILKAQTDFYRLGRLFMALYVLRRTEHATAVSPYLVKELKRLTPAALDVIPNPMPNYVLDAGFGRKMRNFRDAPPRVAMLLNGWGAIKNPTSGMLAMAIMGKTYPQARMHLFGPGFGAGEPAQRWAEEQGIADLFFFHGRIPHVQAMRELAGMDLLIHPAVEESFGMTIAEAMALGVPLVAGHSSGAVSWVSGDGAAGGLVDVRSPQAIASAALHLLEDEDRYRECSARGRARALDLFSAASVVAAYVGQYREVLNSPTRVRAGRGGRDMKVLHVLNELKPSGAETMLKSAAPHWRDMRVECEILATGAAAGPYAGALKAAGYVISHLPSRRRPAYFLNFYRFVRQGGYAVVHQHAEGMSFWFALAALVAGAKVVRTIHSNFSFEGNLRWRRACQRRLLQALGARMVAIAPGVAANERIRFGVHTDLVWNWIDTEKFVPITLEERSSSRARWGFAAAETVLVTVGNCSSIKNHDLLIEALAKLPASSNVRYLHVGLEDAACSEKRLADSLGVRERIAFAGWTPNTREALAAADLYVMPSRYEGLGMAAVEALSAGLPALLTRVPGLRDLEGVFPSIAYCDLSSDGLAQAIAEFCASRSELEQLALNHPVPSSISFSSERGAREYGQIYQDLNSK